MVLFRKHRRPSNVVDVLCRCIVAFVKENNFFLYPAIFLSCTTLPTYSQMQFHAAILKITLYGFIVNGNILNWKAGKAKKKKDPLSNYLPQRISSLDRLDQFSQAPFLT